MSDNPLEIVSQITEFNDLHEFLQDEDVDRALHLVLKILFEKGSIPATQAPRLIVELQALATKFAIMATYYQTVGRAGNNESHKKNIMFTMKESLTKIADSIKYIAKEVS